jgi:uncharacterized membrane protein YphA (DoxX/SURF4 family)
VVVIANADGRPGVNVDVAAGAEVPGLNWVVAALLSVGGCLLLLGALLLWAALRTPRSAGSDPS